MLFSELSKITGGKILQLEEDCELSKFSIDSRKIIARISTVFLAIRGKQNDGHDFIEDVAALGVSNFIIENEKQSPTSGNVLLVQSGTAALQAIATHHRGLFDYPVIGITGSNGKTTVKEWLWEILTKEKKVIKNPKSYNSQVGVPLSILEMGAHDLGIFEAGISQVEEMEKLAKIIQPDYGIFTNIGEAHSRGFDSQREKIQEKAKLFGSADKIIVRFEHENIRKVLEAKVISTVTWSIENEKADYLFDISTEKIDLVGSSLSFTLPFQNSNQVENALHAVVMALELGISNDSIQSTMESLRPVPMRLELKKAINNCYVIDDTYNNDLFGLEVALDFLNDQNPHQEKLLILSDIIQSSLSNEDLSKKINSLVQAKGVAMCIHIGNQLNLNGLQFGTTDDFLNQLPDFENQTILVKGARSFAFEKIVERLENKTHGTILEINFEALRRNLNQYRSLLKPKTKLMVMVKALAYGSGLSEVASFLQNEAADYLGVAYVDEAIELRKKGITLPIMIMNPEETDFSLFEKYDLEAEIYSPEILKRFIKSGTDTNVHLKLETGMNRLGFTKKELSNLLSLLKENPSMKVSGIFTHFSSSDAPDEDAFTHQQASDFVQMVEKIVNDLGYRPLVHAVNSPGMIRFPEYHFDMVRLGIGLYGFDPTTTLTMEPVSQLKTSISQIKNLKADDTVGYSRKGKLNKDSTIAIIPIGYADGYLRVFGNGNGKIGIGNKLAPTVGNICMDMTMIDVTGLNVQTGDEVTIFGSSPTIQDLAKWSNTIPYEILTNVSERVKRIYVSE